MPSPDLQEYEEQKAHNEANFRKAMQIVRPDLLMLMDLLDSSRVDFMILVHVLYALERLATGTKYGEVRVFVENGTVTFVRGEESKKINLPILKSQ